MKKFLILSLTLVTALIYSDIAFSRSKARVLDHFKGTVSGSSGSSGRCRPWAAIPRGCTPAPTGPCP